MRNRNIRNKRCNSVRTVKGKYKNKNRNIQIYKNERYEEYKDKRDMRIGKYEKREDMKIIKVNIKI